MEQRILFRGYSPPNISSYAPLKISVDFSFPANSSYSLHQIKLKLGIYLDHDVAQRILFRGYSPPNVCRVMPLRKFL